MEPTQKFFEPFGQQIRFEAVLSVSEFEHNTFAQLLTSKLVMTASSTEGVVHVKLRHCVFLELSVSGRGGASSGSKGTVGKGSVSELKLLVVWPLSVLTAT